MQIDDEYMYAVRKSFVFLKDNLNFEDLKDKLIQEHLITNKEIEDFIGKIFKSERLIKLIIKEKRCNNFISFIKMSCDKHIFEKIEREIRENSREARSLLIGAVNTRPIFEVTGELLQKHFGILYTELEPRKIADLMFQDGHITIKEHNDLTACEKKHKRLKYLLSVLKTKQLYVPFLCILKFLEYKLVLETLETDKKLENPPSECTHCIQHNFTLLQMELPDPDHATDIMGHKLNETDIADINSCEKYGKIRHKSKLLKILLTKGNSACLELFRVIAVDLKREDLIETMKLRSIEKVNRGRPVLNAGLSGLGISCLQEYGQFLLDELEPVDLCDLLFEEKAIETHVHDKITETKKQLKQAKQLIETVKENENDCFHFFLFTLQRDEYEHIRKELEKPVSRALRDESSKQLHWKASHRILKVSDGARNEQLQLNLTVHGRIGAQMEAVLYKRINSRATEIGVQTISEGEMIFEKADFGSIVIQLRPVTDHGVQTLLNAKENNKLLEMIIGMLQNVDIDKSMVGAEPLQIRVKVYYVDSATTKPDTKPSRTTQIKHRLKAHRNALICELEPKAIVSVLSKSKDFPESGKTSIKNCNCKKEVENLLSMVENGSTAIVEEFVAALRDLGYCDIVELIDPLDIHPTAESFKTKIMSNYNNILSEMNMRFANETLSKCIGDVDLIREKILPRNGNRRKRMNDFLQFILQEDNNVIEFERMLRNNGLDDLLKKDERKETQDIEVTLVEDPISSSSEGVLFESVITLSKIEPPYIDFGGVTANTGELTIHYYIHGFKVSDRSPNLHKIQWTKNGTALDLNDIKYFGGGLHNKFIRIKTLTLEDRGKYTCTVTNAAGTASKDIFLDAPKANITTEPNVLLGSETIFKSVISSYLPPDVVKWQKSQDGLSFHCIDISTPKYDGSSLEPESPRLIIRKTTFDDRLYYRLIVGSTFGENISNTLHLNIIGSPPNVITSYETDFQNRSVKMIAKVFMYSGMEIAVQDVFWTKNGEKIDILRREEKYSEVSVEDPSLTIFNVNPHDAGSYQLTAINAVGSTQSDAIILGIPEIIFERNERKEGNYLFRTTITSIPAPYFAEWQMKKNNDDTFSSLNCYAEEFKGTTNVLPHPVLVVKKRNLGDYCFQINVMNFIGSTKMIIPGDVHHEIPKFDSQTYAYLKPFKSSIEDNVRFAVLFDKIAEAFPMIKFNQLKDLISITCEIKDKTSLHEAKSVRDCLRILWDNKLFMPSDVIIIQILLKKTDCLDLYEQCIKYAEAQNALCFYEKQSECGNKRVQFHVRGNLSDYDKEKIQEIIVFVAAVFGCTTEEIHICGYLHSTSFIVVFAVKEIYLRNLLAMKQQDKDKLCSLNIDYLIVDDTTIFIECLKGNSFLAQNHLSIFENSTINSCNPIKTLRMTAASI